jgi:hypothetical protein
MTNMKHNRSQVMENSRATANAAFTHTIGCSRNIVGREDCLHPFAQTVIGKRHGSHVNIRAIKRADDFALGEFKPSAPETVDVLPK